jgi:hypothetical protein
VIACPRGDLSWPPANCILFCGPVSKQSHHLFRLGKNHRAVAFAKRAERGNNPLPWNQGWRSLVS